MNDMLSGLPRRLWWALASAALMVIAGFAPWATALDTISVSGTDGDGWFVIVGGAIAGALLWRHARSGARGLAIGAAVIGALCTLIALYDLSDVNDVADAAGLGSVIDPGWGLYLAIVASVSLTAASVVALRAGRATTTVTPVG